MRARRHISLAHCVVESFVVALSDDDGGTLDNEAI